MNPNQHKNYHRPNQQHHPQNQAVPVYNHNQPQPQNQPQHQQIPMMQQMSMQQYPFPVNMNPQQLYYVQLSQPPQSYTLQAQPTMQMSSYVQSSMTPFLATTPLAQPAQFACNYPSYQQPTMVLQPPPQQPLRIPQPKRKAQLLQIKNPNTQESIGMQNEQADLHSPADPISGIHKATKASTDDEQAIPEKMNDLHSEHSRRDSIPYEQEHVDVDSEDQSNEKTDTIADDQDEDVVIEELVKQLKGFELEETEKNNPSEQVYGREFLYCARKLVKKIGFPCTCMEMIAEVELDLSNYKPKHTPPRDMTSSPKQQRENKFTAKKSGFNLNWQQQGGQQAGGSTTAPVRHPVFQNRTMGNTNGGGRSNYSKPYSYAGRHSIEGKQQWKQAPHYAGRSSYDKRHRTQSPLTQIAHNVPTAEGNKNAASRTESLESQVKSSQETTEQEGDRKKKVWKPMRRALEGASAEEVRVEKMTKEVRGILNKITPSSYEELTDDFCKYKIYLDKLLLPKIVDLIFDKAVEEPHFCALYSDLCKKQVVNEINDEKGSEFRNALLTKCQHTFIESTISDQKIEELKKKATQEGISVENVKLLEAEAEKIRSKEKRRLLGVISLISCCFCHGLLTLEVMCWCANNLLKRGLICEKNKYKVRDEEYIWCVVGLLEKIGEHYEKERKKLKENDERKKEKEEAAKSLAQRIAPSTTKAPAEEQSKGSQLIAQIETIFVFLAQVKEEVSSRIRFKIMDLEELRAKNWIPRGGKKGPKTIEEVREEASKEESEKMAERHMYDMKKDQEREKNFCPRGMMAKGSDKQPITKPYNYMGRNSLPDQHKRSAAAIPSASNAGPTTNRLRNTNLQTLDKTDFSSKKYNINKAPADNSTTWRSGQQPQGSK